MKRGSIAAAHPPPLVLYQSASGKQRDSDERLQRGARRWLAVGARSDLLPSTEKDEAIHLCPATVYRGHGGEDAEAVPEHDDLRESSFEKLYRLAQILREPLPARVVAPRPVGQPVPPQIHPEHVETGSRNLLRKELPVGLAMRRYPVEDEDCKIRPRPHPVPEEDRLAVRGRHELVRCLELRPQSAYVGGRHVILRFERTASRCL